MKFRIPYVRLLVAPVALYALGAALNIIAISANHGMMPVAMQTTMKMMLENQDWLGGIIDSAHTQMVSASHLKILCDWIQIPHLGTASIGDGLMALSDYVKDYVWGAWLALVARDYSTK